MNKGVILSVLALLLTAACNTMEGFGKDMQGAGEGLANTASSVKEKITSPQN